MKGILLVSGLLSAYLFLPLPQVELMSIGLYLGILWSRWAMNNGQ